jgi:BCCT family betaine/carnitine transporter
MFIARISRGRTVREYFSVVLLAPFAICVVWFSAFGETAVFQYETGTGDLAGGIVNSATVLFQMLAAMPWGSVTSVIAIGLLIVFIVTSADSGALVVDTITSGGKTDAPVAQRVFWACMLGLTASALLYGGGTSALESLQAGTIAAALPFTIVLLICCLSLYLGMRDEVQGVDDTATQQAAPEPPTK